MSQIQHSLIKFIESKTLKVAILQGAWGTGKTHFWRKFIDDNVDKLQYKATSYASLFGANEINDLRNQIFSNLKLNEDGIKAHFEKLKPLYKLFQSIDIPYLKDNASISSLIEGKLINNLLICFDDLERKELTISVSSILGLVTQLKEEHNCKIILIFNDQYLDSEAKKELDEYREKVVDMQITYKPNIQDNINIIWPEGCPESTTEIFLLAELNNLRIMQRVKWAQEYISKGLIGFPHLIEHFERKVAILTILYHAHSSKLTLKEVTSTSYYSLIMGGDDEDKERFKIIKTLNYMPEEQDQMIVEYLVDGYVEFEKYNSVLNNKSDYLKIADLNAKHRLIWEKYNCSFAATQEQFVNEQIQFINENIEVLRINDVLNTISFIEKLDCGKDLSLTLERAIDIFAAKVTDPKKVSLRDIPDKYRALINAKIATRMPELGITESFSLLIGESWNPGDIQLLARFSEQEFYNWLISENQIDVIGCLETFLERFGRQSESGKIVENIKAALDRIGSRSLLDLERVKLVKRYDKSTQYT